MFCSLMIDFEIIVIGGGHAGIEAACAAARMGLPTALISGDLNKIGEMSCNPAIGGTGKGQLVREIDALGGVMGYITDNTGIHFRTLNKSKGPAVWSSRAQCDRKLYREFAQQVIAATQNLTAVSGMAVGITTQGCDLAGVVLSDGREIRARACILASGTFLNGLIHIGEEQIPAGRVNEAPSLQLSESLQELGFVVGRLKTGTPPRLEGQTIDYDRLEPQPGDDSFRPFSMHTTQPVVNRALCHIAYTSAETHRIVQANLHRSAMFSGNIQGVGPRYCPSIEDKIYRFRDKERHQLFIEPEGLDTTEIYINGLSTSLPADVQLEILHSIQGLEHVTMKRPGYAIEYDFFPAHQIKPTLETRHVNNFYFCGQINGTSGYEEAAAQGLLAGINAARKLRHQEPFILDRSEAYIGVMIDDLVTRTPTEPYRMFTSRAEYRLALREDNAADRLIGYGHEFGLVGDEAYDRFLHRRQSVEDEKKRLNRTLIPVAWVDPAANGDKQQMGILLRRPRLSYADFAKFDAVCAAVPIGIAEQVEIEIKYAGYLEKQDREIARFRELETKRIPEGFDISKVTGLKKEAVQIMAKFRPVNLGQASRLAGITYSDITVLMIHLKRYRETNVSRETS